MADIVAFMLELDVMSCECLRCILDVGEGVTEDVCIRLSDIVPLPVEFPGLVTFCEWMK